VEDEWGWSAGSQVHRPGFHVYRSQSSDSPWIRLKDRMLPSEVPTSSRVCATYAFMDEDAEADVTYYYRLEGIDVRGNRTSHGPVTGMMPLCMHPTEESSP